VADLGTLYSRFVDQVKRGETLGPDVSMLKVFATETYSRLANLLVEIAGASGAHRATSMSRAAASMC
jgi:alkylation response protein AidB-like acyl-CoA dehydrogenase